MNERPTSGVELQGGEGVDTGVDGATSGTEGASRHQECGPDWRGGVGETRER